MIFSDIKGQPHAINKLESYINSDRIPSALIFLGPDGVGRKSAALELAKYLNCGSKNQQEKPCGDCPSCVQISKNLHPFVTMVDLKWQSDLLGKEFSEISIDTVREIQRTLSLKSTHGKERIVVINPAQKLSKEAANSFLKTLEEPPSDTIIILICNSRKNVLPTIISRCQIVEFKLLDKEIIMQKLKERELEADESRLEIYVDMADGSMSKAMHYLENWNELDEEKRLFYSMELNALKDVDLPSLFSLIAAEHRKEFEDCPQRFLYLWEAVIKAKKQVAAGVNRNMLLTELHAAVSSHR